MLAHDLNKSPGFTAALTMSSKLGPKQRVSIEDTVSKRGQSYKASSELVLAARRRKCQIFQRIRVESLQTSVPDDTKQLSESTNSGSRMNVVGGSLGLVVFEVGILLL